MKRLSVLLTTEGTYPFHEGGVSTWCHTLTHGVPEVDFLLLTVMMHPYLKQRYRLAPNVRSLIKVPLWGTEEPAEYSWHDPFSFVLQRKWSTTEQAVAARFVHLFERFLHVITMPEADQRELGDILLALYTYFQSFDYHRTMRAKCVWTCFQQALRVAWRDWLPASPDPTVAELTDALRLLYRFLIVLQAPIPRTDITHSAAAAFCGLPCVIAKLQHGTPYLLTEHGVYSREQYLNLQRRIPSCFVRSFMYRFIAAIVRVNYHFADQISPVCAYNSRWERWWGVPAEQIKVIYNGVDPDKFYPIEYPKNPRPLVSSVSLIYPLKGQLDLIEAATLVRAQIPNVEFRFYGSVSDERYFAQCRERVRAQQLESTVVFAGSTKEPQRVYCQADVVAFSSISEGSPYAVIEALASGAAIVATDAGGMPEAIGDAGLVVRTRCPAEMAQAILSLLQSPSERNRLSVQGRARAQRLFTQARFLNEYRESYQRLALTLTRAQSAPSLTDDTIDQCVGTA